MTSPEHDPHAAPPTVPHLHSADHPAHMSFWIRELPFSLALLLTLGGVAYTSFSKQPLFIYWEMLAPIIALV